MGPEMSQDIKDITQKATGENYGKHVPVNSHWWNESLHRKYIRGQLRMIMARMPRDSRSKQVLVDSPWVLEAQVNTVYSTEDGSGRQV